MGTELERTLKARSGPNPRYYLAICPEGLGKTTKVFSQDNRCLGSDSNWSPPEYKSGAWVNLLDKLWIAPMAVWYLNGEIRPSGDPVSTGARFSRPRRFGGTRRLHLQVREVKLKIQDLFNVVNSSKHNLQTQSVQSCKYRAYDLIISK
jgi:hypothetical protein